MACRAGLPSTSVGCTVLSKAWSRGSAGAPGPTSSPENFLERQILSSPTPGHLSQTLGAGGGGLVCRVMQMSHELASPWTEHTGVTVGGVHEALLARWAVTCGHGQAGAEHVLAGRRAHAWPLTLRQSCEPGVACAVASGFPAPVGWCAGPSCGVHACPTQ